MTIHRAFNLLGMGAVAAMLVTFLHLDDAHAQLTLGPDEYVAYESATLGTTGVGGGLNVVDVQWLGTSFTTDRDIRLTQLGGHFVAADANEVILAIFPLDDTGLPRVPPILLMRCLV